MKHHRTYHIQIFIDSVMNDFREATDMLTKSL